MQEQIPTKLSLESENKYPDCLWMQLEIIPVQLEGIDTQQVDLYLSVNFNEHWEPLLGGRVKFGLKGGELRLKLENGQMPLPSRHLSGNFNLLSKEEQNAGVPTPLNSCHIGTKGWDTDPAWVFDVRTGESVLKGAIENAKLGTLTLTDKSYRLEATFEVSNQDVYLTDAEGLWKHDISPNQHAVLERKLALFLLENKLKPYLSWAHLCRDRSPTEKPLAAIDRHLESELQAVVQQIVTAESQDFLELLQIARLDPLKDLVGGNLRGTTLNGVDLGGANLMRTNFRGADLTDAELTDANLNSANLGGVDLSGADLGNADLSHTNLHHASLALANLSGANLGGANLNGANFSNANLSGAKVKEARFSKNIGISEETKQHLLERGAIFED